MPRKQQNKRQPPVSLHPLEPEDALAGLLRVKPEKAEEELEDGEKDGTQEEDSDRGSGEEASREEG
ncbi:MAG: hypothetical protein HQ475_14860 [SAR202 cluster bacterium]|nr:hypothetical protein [SAR202 cluster bacterium]